jgi:hypothetical protein
MSQTRRRGNQILQDEIDSAIALVKTHTTNITRKLEKVKDMVSRYCENKGTASSAPAPSAPSAPVTQFSAPTPTVLSPIPETNETNFNTTNANSLAPMGSASVPVSLKSKGPKPWTNFRTMVGKDTQLKVGQTETSKKIATLWEQAKKGSSTNQIAQYLKNQLQVPPSLANKKAPELAKLAINYAKPTLSKRVTRTVRSGPTVNKTRNAPINPNTETDDEFWARMGRQANANAANKNARAMQQAENRRISRGEAALRATPALTPGKSRQVPLAANANVNRSSPIPTLVRNPTVVNPTTGKEEELSL